MEPASRKVVKHAAPRTTRVLNLRGLLPRPVECESTLEDDFVSRAALCPVVVDIAHQPFKVTNPDGSQYTPDFLVILIDGTRVVVEVKVRRKIARYRALFEAVTPQLNAHGFSFLVVDETMLRADRAHWRVRKILRYLKAFFPEDQCSRVIAAVLASAVPTFGSITKETGAERSLIYHLLAKKRLATERRLLLDDAAPLFVHSSESANEDQFECWIGA